MKQTKSSPNTNMKRYIPSDESILAYITKSVKKTRTIPRTVKRTQILKNNPSTLPSPGNYRKWIKSFLRMLRRINKKKNLYEEKFPQQFHGPYSVINQVDHSTEASQQTALLVFRPLTIFHFSSTRSTLFPSSYWHIRFCGSRKVVLAKWLTTVYRPGS